ncbi:MAG: competence/damage-inducible protein A [Verrucomicrobiota bacterium]|nr:competence/damage-inducible protein A [Verrucomicrobiota bacterium]
MEVIVINTGTELLLGDVLNTHLAFIAREILPIGLRVASQQTVPDGAAIESALRDAFSRADLIFVTGGLGPTTDDITREVTAKLLNLELCHDANVMEAITHRASQRGYRLTDRIPRQAMVPEGAVVLPNANGTAPGLYLRKDINPAEQSPHIFLLPGPPRELRPMFLEHVIPRLGDLVPPEAHRSCQTYRIVGMGESLVEEALGDELLAMAELELGYCAHAGAVDLRIIGSPTAMTHADDLIMSRLGKSVVSRDGTTLEQALVRLLRDAGASVAVAESCTGGFLAHRLTNVPGASAVFKAGYVTYGDETKVDALGVGADLIREHGAVSEPVARAMAEGARQRADATFALSTTGIAGPDGGSGEKPVGTVFIGLASSCGTEVAHRYFPEDRETFKQLVTQAALDILRRRLT